MDRNYKGPLRGAGQAVGLLSLSLLVRSCRPDLSCLQVTRPLNGEEYAVKLKIATCQFPVSRDLERNFKYVVRQMKYASEQGAHLAHFSETCLGGYVRGRSPVLRPLRLGLAAPVHDGDRRLIPQVEAVGHSWLQSSPHGQPQAAQQRSTSSMLAALWWTATTRCSAPGRSAQRRAIWISTARGRAWLHST